LSKVENEGDDGFKKDKTVEMKDIKKKNNDDGFADADKEEAE